MGTCVIIAAAVDLTGVALANLVVETIGVALYFFTGELLGPIL